MIRDILLGIRAHDREPSAVSPQRGERFGNAREEADRIDVLRHPAPHVPRDRGQFPHRHLQPADDLAIVEVTQRLALVLRGAAKAETPGDLVQRAEEPVGAIGQRSIEVEDG